MEQQLPQQNPQMDPSLRSEQGYFFHVPTVDLVRHQYQNNRFFRAHAVIAGAIMMGLIGIWAFVSLGVRQFPWPALVASFFLVTLATHYFLVLEHRDYLGLHIALFSIINVMLTFIWAAGSGTSKWFLYPLFGWGIFLSIHIIQIRLHDNPHKRFYCHLAAFACIIALIFSAGSGAARFIVIVIPAVGILPTIHWALHYHPGNYWKLHLAIFTDIQLLFFFIWILKWRTTFPFFIFPLMIWSLVLFIHAYTARKAQMMKQGLNQPSIMIVNETTPTPGSYEAGTVAPSNFVPVNLDPSAPMVEIQIQPDQLYPVLISQNQSQNQ